MFQEVRRVPEWREQAVKGPQALGIHSALGSSFPEAALRRLFPRQGFVRKVLQEKPVREQAKWCKEGKKTRMQCPVKSQAAWRLSGQGAGLGHPCWSVLVCELGEWEVGGSLPEACHSLMKRLWEPM